MAKDDDILEEARELFELCEEREADNRDEALDVFYTRAKDGRAAPECCRTCDRRILPSGFPNLWLDR